MTTQKTTTKKTATKPKAEKPVAKPKAEKAVVAPKAEKSAAAAPAKAKPATTSTSSEAVASKKPKTTAVKAPELSVHERVDATAGAIWHYLSANGVTTAAKLLRELQEEEKIVQRSIGWLAQEGKLVFVVNGQTESISLKD